MNPDEPRVPRFVKLIAAIVIAGLGIVVFTAWQVSSILRHEDQRDCRRAVAERDDDRAVWLHLLERSSDRADDPDVIAFVAFLDDRLPALTCVGRTPIPITTEEG